MQILASLILVNCYKGGMAVGDSSDPPSPPASLHIPSENVLEVVIAHRVLPFLFRKLNSWAALPANVPHSSSVDTAISVPATCKRFAEAVANAVTATMELGSWQRQREATAYGAVDSLTAFLSRARAIAVAAPAGARHSNNQNGEDNEEQENEREYLLGPSRAALYALATLCARCEYARERVVALGFHSAVSFWLLQGEGSESLTSTDRKTCYPAGSGTKSDISLSLGALLLVRNMGRSSVSCSALVGVRAYKSLIKALVVIGEGIKIEIMGESDKVVSSAAEGLALATAGLANMALEHDVVKEAIVRSGCLQKICESAVDISEDKNVGFLAVELDMVLNYHRDCCGFL